MIYGKIAIRKFRNGGEKLSKQGILTEINFREVMDSLVGLGTVSLWCLKLVSVKRYINVEIFKMMIIF